MDYYQAVITEYLSADRALFVNNEFCLQLNEADNPDVSGPHWYVDALTLDFRDSTIFLCEMTYSASLDSLAKRLKGWAESWPLVKSAVCRDAYLPDDWQIRPWIFVPEALVPILLRKLSKIDFSSENAMPMPRVTTMEMVQPWNYRAWNRVGEKEKPHVIPVEMRT